jgi:hypothetical protein
LTAVGSFSVNFVFAAFFRIALNVFSNLLKLEVLG